jgi:predicted AAA+ superfamily ATPase
MEIARKDYLDLLSASSDMPRTVKVLIGMRRTGKTTIMNQFMQIITDDTDEGNIFHIDLDLTFDKISVEELKNMMQPVLDAKGMHYIFLDEIQNVDEWERLVAMLVARGDLRHLHNRLQFQDTLVLAVYKAVREVHRDRGVPVLL